MGNMDHGSTGPFKAPGPQRGKSIPSQKNPRYLSRVLVPGLLFSEGDGYQSSEKVLRKIGFEILKDPAPTTSSYLLWAIPPVEYSLRDDPSNPERRLVFMGGIEIGVAFHKRSGGKEEYISLYKPTD